jgi:hypothetical protein
LGPLVELASDLDLGMSKNKWLSLNGCLKRKLIKWECIAYVDEIVKSDL